MLGIWPRVGMVTLPVVWDECPPLQTRLDLLRYNMLNFLRYNMLDLLRPNMLDLRVLEGDGLLV